MGEDRGAAALQEIYTELERLFGGASCPRSTRCCRFEQTGRRPYLYAVEARRLLLGVGRRGGKLPTPVPGEDGECPLLLAGGGCGVYADRPFGCRTFFCGDAELPGGRRSSEVDALVTRLRALSESLGESELAPITTWAQRSFDRQGRRLKVVR